MNGNLFMFIWGLLLGYIVNDIITGILAIIHQKDKSKMLDSMFKHMESSNGKEKDGKTKG